MGEGTITDKMSRRLVLITSTFAALLAVYTIAFSLRMGYADKYCRDHGYTEARATWSFKMNCLKTTGVKDGQDSVLPAAQARSRTAS
jgi:hypothetical protein